MVERGQVLERMTTVEGPQGALEALWQGGGVVDVHQTPIVLCPPHPRLGGSIDSPVLAELVWTLGHRRHPTLRFNFAGVGASLGTSTLPSLPAPVPLTEAQLQPLVDDAAAAIAHLLASTGERRCFVIGVSVGALVAARLAITHDAVEQVALVAPPLDVGALDAAALDASGTPWRVYVGGDDTFAPSARLLATAPRAVVIPHGNHTFSRGLPQLARAVADALSPLGGDGGDDGDGGGVQRESLLSLAREVPEGFDEGPRRVHRRRERP